MNGRRPLDATLEWHRAGTNAKGGFVSRAWAPKLMPEAVMPPYYEIEQTNRNLAERAVDLVQCKTCGGQRELVTIEGTLAEAKATAQRDYDKRIEQQTLTSPPKSA